MRYESGMNRGGVCAPYAYRPERSRGRLYHQPDSPGRNAFQRDRARIVHSTAFRRLKDKTQVFIYHEGDHYRTRLTHSLEVAQIARAMASMLAVDENLSEGLALAHDLGHPPFGHAGEIALNDMMLPYGGFDHNAQALRIVSALEHRYADFDGLNLTWETLEGLVKHNGPLISSDGAPVARYAATGLPYAVAAYAERQDLELSSFSGLEAQIAAVADDIAYDSHDVDDGLRAGFLRLDDMHEAPLFGPCLRQVDDRYPGLEYPRRLNETLRRLITLMVNDLVGESVRRLNEDRPDSPEDVRRGPRPIACFSEAVRKEEQGLKVYLKNHVYQHERVVKTMNDAEQIVRDLFARYMRDRDSLPPEWRDWAVGLDELDRARAICDFVAGMTDRFALCEHERLFDVTPELR